MKAEESEANSSDLQNHSQSPIGPIVAPPKLRHPTQAAVGSKLLAVYSHSALAHHVEFASNAENRNENILLLLWKQQKKQLWKQQVLMHGKIILAISFHFFLIPLFGPESLSPNWLLKLKKTKVEETYIYIQLSDHLHLRQSSNQNSSASEAVEFLTSSDLNVAKRHIEVLQNLRATDKDDSTNSYD